MSRAVDRCLPLIKDERLRPLSLLNLLLGSGYSFVTPFMSLFGTQEVGMSTWMVGVFMTIVAAGGIVIGTTLALYSDTHFSRRSMLLLGSVAAVVGYVGFAYLRSVLALVLVGTFILGVSSITFSQLFAHARETLKRMGTKPSEMAFFMNAFRMFFALSWTVGPAVASWVMVSGGYEALFLCAAGNFALFGWVVWKAVPYEAPSAKAAETSEQAGFWRLMARRDLMAHLLAFVFISCSTTMAMMNLPLLILVTLAGRETQVGIAYCVAPIFEIPLMLYFGWLATRQPVTALIRFGMGLAVIYYVLLSVVTVPWQVYPVQLLSAGVIAIISGLAITYFQSHLPHHPGTATNLYAIAQRIGSTAGFLAFGTLATAYGHRGVFVGCAVIAVVAFVLMWVPVVARAESEAALPVVP